MAPKKVNVVNKIIKNNNKIKGNDGTYICTHDIDLYRHTRIYICNMQSGY